MTADEARGLTEAAKQKALANDPIFDRIRAAADRGDSSVCAGFIPLDSRLYLQQLGYTLSYDESDRPGFGGWVVKWGADS